MAAAQPPRKRPATSVPADATGKAVGHGVPLSLAVDRAQRVSDLRYNLRFDVPGELATRIRGTATIRFTLKDATRPLALDFSESGRLDARIGGRTVSLIGCRRSHRDSTGGSARGSQRDHAQFRRR